MGEAVSENYNFRKWLPLRTLGAGILSAQWKNVATEYSENLVAGSVCRM